MALEKANIIKGVSFALILIIAAIGGYFYIDNTLKNVIIDNPTTAEISVKIDETEYKIPAKSNVTAKIGYGKHTASLNGENVGEFDHQRDDMVVLFDKIFELKHSVLNPTKQDYILETLVYGGTSIPDPKVINDLYISQRDNHWHYAIDETAPTTITSKRRGSITKYKIWRSEDFTKEYGVNIEEIFSEMNDEE